MLREVREEDLPLFFKHQLAPEAQHMAGFPPQDRDAFLAHWRTRILGNSEVLKSAIVYGDHVVGNIVTWQESGRRLLGYWLGQEHWGQGIASTAVAEFLRTEPTRPLFAYVTVHNHRSIRILKKCGFAQVGSIEARPDGTEEYLFRLDG